MPKVIQLFFATRVYDIMTDLMYFTGHEIPDKDSGIALLQNWCYRPPTWALAQQKSHALARMILFLFGYTQPIRKLLLRLKQYTLYSMAREWRKKNSLCKSTFSRHHIHKKVKVKGRELSKEREIFTIHQSL